MCTNDNIGGRFEDLFHKYVSFVAVRPERTEIIGLNGPVEDGTVVGLTCRTSGARPAAWITWYNGSAPFAETPTDDVALRVSESRNCGFLVKVYLRHPPFPTEIQRPPLAVTKMKVTKRAVDAKRDMF